MNEAGSARSKNWTFLTVLRRFFLSSVGEAGEIGSCIKQNLILLLVRREAFLKLNNTNRYISVREEMKMQKTSCINSNTITVQTCVEFININAIQWKLK